MGRGMTRGDAREGYSRESRRWLTGKESDRKALERFRGRRKTGVKDCFLTPLSCYITENQLLISFGVVRKGG
jgi:hypothetical protein